MDTCGDFGWLTRNIVNQIPRFVDVTEPTFLSKARYQYHPFGWEGIAFVLLGTFFGFGYIWVLWSSWQVLSLAATTIHLIRFRVRTKSKKSIILERGHFSSQHFCSTPIRGLSSRIVDNVHPKIWGRYPTTVPYWQDSYSSRH